MDNHIKRDLALARRLLAERSFRIFITAREHTRSPLGFCAVNPTTRHLCLISVNKMGHLVFRYHVSIHYYKPIVTFLQKRLHGKLRLGKPLPLTALDRPREYIVASEHAEFENLVSPHYHAQSP
jgi:hypothetical protein